MVEDMYIRAIVNESTTVPEKQKKRILERFTTRQLLFENNRYYCPHCKMPTPKISNYCCNCGQKVTLEKPTIIKTSKDECDKEFSDRKLILSDEKCKIRLDSAEESDWLEWMGMPCKKEEWEEILK